MSPRARRLTAALAGLLRRGCDRHARIRGSRVRPGSPRPRPVGGHVLPLAQSRPTMTAVAGVLEPDRLKKADDAATPEDRRPEAPRPPPRPAAARAAPPGTPPRPRWRRAPSPPHRRTVQPAPPTKKRRPPPLPPPSGRCTSGSGRRTTGARPRLVSRRRAAAWSRRPGTAPSTPRQSKPADYWVFVPAYARGQQPEGIYVGHTLTLHDRLRQGDYDYDYAFVTVHRGFKWEASKDAKGQSTYRRGGRRACCRTTSAARASRSAGAASVAATAFGYPGGAPARRQPPVRRSRAEVVRGPDPEVGIAHLPARPRHRHQGCAFTAGASGGPWLIVYNPATGAGLLNGVNSLSWNRNADGKNDEISSPYFNASTRSSTTTPRACRRPDRLDGVCPHLRVTRAPADSPGPRRLGRP